MSSKPSKPVSLEEQRTARYWRHASPAQCIVYSWLTGEEPPAYRPKNEQRRRPYRKTDAKRPKRLAA